MFRDNPKINLMKQKFNFDLLLSSCYFQIFEWQSRHIRNHCFLNNTIMRKFVLFFKLLLPNIFQLSPKINLIKLNKIITVPSTFSKIIEWLLDLECSSVKLRRKSCTWLFHEDQATGKPRLPIHDLPGHRSVAIWTKAREESRHCPFRRVSIWNHVPFCPLPLCVRCRSSLPTKFRDLSRVSLRFLSPPRASEFRDRIRVRDFQVRSCELFDFVYFVITIFHSIINNRNN